MSEIKEKLFDAFREDHAALGRGLHELRQRLVARDAEGARAAAETLDREAGAHIAFEEADFYPALGETLTSEEIEEMYREHRRGLSLVRDTMQLSDQRLASDRVRDALIARVDAMEEHVSECGELFGAVAGLPEARKQALFDDLKRWRTAAPRWTAFAKTTTR